MKNQMKLISSTLTLVGIVSMTACSSDEPGNGSEQPNPRHSIQLNAEQREIAKENLGFSFKVWDKMTDATPKGNQFFSPLGMHMTLSMLANGADEEARQELTTFLGAKDLQSLNGFNKLMLTELPKVDNTVKFSLANSAWFDNAITPGQQFVDVCRSVFTASVFSYDKGSSKAMQDVNKWCSDNTGGMIPAFLSEPPSGNFLLLNAAYFNGKWKNPFDAALTAKEEFTCESGKKATVDMMHLSGVKVNWCKTPKYTSFWLEYGNGGYSMFLVLPNEGLTVNDVMEQKIITYEYDAASEYHTGDLCLSLPKFSLSEDNANLANVLCAAGLTKTFSESGHFSSIFNGCTPSAMRQKTVLQVNESGTVATAVTETGDATSPGNDPLKIAFDRPFGLIIMENSTSTILYMGKVAEL